MQSDFERLIELQYQLAIQTKENGRISIVLPEFWSGDCRIVMWLTFNMPDIPRSFLYQEKDFKTCVDKFERDVRTGKYVKELKSIALNASKKESAHG